MDRLWKRMGAPDAPGKDVVAVVKGISRQVIVVKSPDPKLFEEAIFILKEEAANREGITADQLIRQARQAANGYLRGSQIRKSWLDYLEGPLWALAGGAAASLVWGSLMLV